MYIVCGSIPPDFINFVTIKWVSLAFSRFQGIRSGSACIAGTGSTMGVM